MAWNQPGNGDQNNNNDPWGNNNNQKKKSSNSTSGLFDKLNESIKKSKTGGNRPKPPSVKPSSAIGFILFIAVLIWAFNGFYTVNQSQRGVITRFGKVQPQVIQPGLNWHPPLIDKVYLVNTQGTRSFNVQGFMITGGENLIFVEMNVQYRINNPKNYLFHVANVEDSLRQAADSALRTEIGSSQMDDILTSGRASLEARTKEGLVNIINRYSMGIEIVDLNFLAVRPPEEVQDAFNDAIKAREDREREINQAKADKVQLEQQAEGRAASILANANAYKVKVVLEAQGDVERFKKLLPEYNAAPELTRERLYIEMMEQVLGKTHKIMVNDKSGNLMVLPLDQMLKKAQPNQTENSVNNYLSNGEVTDFSDDVESNDQIPAVSNRRTTRTGR